MLNPQQIIKDFYLNGCDIPLGDICSIQSTIIEASDKQQSASIKLKLKLPFVYDKNKIIKQLQPILLPYQINLDLTVVIDSYQRANNLPSVGSIKNIIAISSAKGGVGKSTTTVNLAIALQQLGAKVGILDADIYGPSIPHMLGLEDAKPQSLDQKTMQPVVGHGIVSNSIGYLTGAMDPTIWRGPVASTMMQQLLNETNWDAQGELDYLLIDMPPGTGDLQLTLAQKIPVTSAVIVTTPQEIALLDVVKGINMFNEVNVPISGIIENMSFHQCSNCGHVEAIFGLNGGKDVAELSQIELLGTIPLTTNIRRDLDHGSPSVLINPDSEIAEIYRDIASRISISIYKNLKPAGSTIKIKQL